ncbi:hypothetical protein H9657_06725 [Cellulomonas sp. Sa3CUA2]|uniref:DUF3558 domain-containing protein n=1 Tax=Cellulomonas avistercoris TaxID=2762242 RepID=A0ABR8QC60_9CELL|nr:hypothetical protein [Cellulomonas avistercoris]MBD7917971.1 hypothetical protein [Cellulomonas avistercoris]
MRARTWVRDVGAARWVAVLGIGVLGVGVLLTACAGPSTSTPPAEIADAADCAVRETLAALGTGDGEGLPAAPRAGRVPEGFAPVAAVECRMPEVRVLPAPEPPQVLEPGDLPVPGGEDLGTPPPAGTSVDVVRLGGDLGPLLAQLARRDVPARPDQACMAMFEVVPVLYLLDADDRAVHVRWPTDACGFLLDGAREALAGLRETGRTTVSLP